MTKTKSLALSGIFTGLTLAIMWMGSLFPSLDLALPAVAGMFTLLLVMELNTAWALGMFVAAAALSALLLPVKGSALFYMLFFGYYPMIKVFVERKLPKWLAWVCKFAVFNIAAITTYILLTKVLGVSADDFGEVFGKYAKAVLLAVANVTFLMYDHMILSVFALLYRRRWQKKLRKLIGR